MRPPWSPLPALLLAPSLVLAAEPARIASVDPLAHPPPPLRGELILEGAAGGPEGKIVPALRERLARGRGEGPLRVIVTLVESRLESRTGRGPESPAGADLLPGWIAALEHRFVREARAMGFSPERGLAHFPIVIGSISAAQVERLAALPEVRALEPPVELRAARVEGGRLVRSPRLRNQLGGRGAGVGVAVLDTGVDADHPELRGRVGVEADFTGTTGSGAVDDNGHGTAVAGILAGRSGGMAPEATIWAIKVLDAEGTGDTGEILAALDALFGERHDHGGLDVVNLSLVTSAHATHDHCDEQPFPPGDHFPAAALVLASFRAAGIAVFAASGNNGQAAVSFPACLSSTIAVGAVYDADLGPRNFPGLCGDASTRADQLACFSSTGLALDVLAPSACATTAAPGGGHDPCFSGTSAATAYAAGVAAQLLGLHPGTTPEELLTALLETGRPIDVGEGVLRSRIDAVAAHQLLAGGAPLPPFGRWLRSSELPDFEAQVVINGATAANLVLDCIAETLCASGALAGRTEVLLKVIGPRSNGYLWAQISRFTRSSVEVWLRRISTGQINYYRLDAVAPASEDVSGLHDREAFLP